MGKHEALHHARVQPLAYEAQNHSITYPLTKDLPELLAVEGVEKFLDIDIHDPSAGHLHGRVLKRVACVVRGATRSKAVREVVKLLLVDSLQQHRYRALQDLVLEGRNADRSRLRP